MPQNVIKYIYIYQALICLTRVFLNTKPILSVKAEEKDTCCLSVVFALMVD